MLTRNNCNWFVINLNEKHPMWDSLCTNPYGITLHYHEINDYTVADTPTDYPAIPTHRPNVIDIALVKLSSIVIST